MVTTLVLATTNKPPPATVTDAAAATDTGTGSDHHFLATLVRGGGVVSLELWVDKNGTGSDWSD